MAQYGADHTVLVPAWQQSQRGAYDNIVVPNSELDHYDIVYPQEWTVPVDVTGRPFRSVW